MIDYDGRGWLQLLVRLKGSVIPRLLPRVMFTIGLGFAAVLLHEHHEFKIPPTAHTLVGVALGLLLVFRTNTSYDRYWEGRKLLGSMVNRTRDMTRQISAYIVDPEARAELSRLVPAYYWCCAQTLRRDASLGEAARFLTEAQQKALEGITHRAPVITAWMAARLNAEVAAGRLTEQRLQVFDANLMSFNDSLGAAERILRTPIPFAYAHHIKLFVVLFCFTAPFVMVDVMEWATPAAVAFLALALFGIDEIGVEIEDPFGDDHNDLPIAAIGQGIEKAVDNIMTAREVAESSSRAA